MRAAVRAAKHDVLILDHVPHYPGVNIEHETLMKYGLEVFLGRQVTHDISDVNTPLLGELDNRFALHPTVLRKLGPQHRDPFPPCRRAGAAACPTEIGVVHCLT